MASAFGLGAPMYGERLWVGCTDICRVCMGWVHRCMASAYGLGAPTNDKCVWVRFTDIWRVLMSTVQLSSVQ